MQREQLRCYFVAGTQDVWAQQQQQHISAQTALLEVLEDALQTGISCFQFREKGNRSLTDKIEIKRLAQDCQALCNEYNIPFFVNDDVQLALTIKADGIHVGQSDCPIVSLIELCQQQFILGLTINTFQQAHLCSNIQGIDYFGVGPIFPTISKADAQNTVGVELIQQIRQADINTPIVGIGGINCNNAKQVIKNGADGVAVISAITHNNKAVRTAFIQMLISH